MKILGFEKPFGVKAKGFSEWRTVKVKLETLNDGSIYGHNVGTTFKSSYTQDELNEHKRIQQDEKPLEDNDIVLIDGKQYQAEVFSADHSDCVNFNLIDIPC
jgi:hypothetical protein